ncbi:MAG: hypothetical protein A2X86_19530 [Bdellovibrionales bacterium GWA2_49_15]|nr:MAG: hypothetical protein A2X86_19530 [Bdellovibrionales bacterium GWA2_49_15]HAZ14424.1 hypothetical protein [Bdellovibrionales bacterium]
MKYLILILVFCVSPLCRAQAIFNCELNSNIPGVELPAEEYAKKVKTFNYKAQEAPQGVKFDNGEISAFLATKEGHIHILLKELKTENKAQATFLPAQARIAFQLGANNALSCQHPGAHPASGAVDVANLKNDSDLLQLQAPFKVTVARSFYVQFENSAEMMWTASFQGGAVVPQDKAVDKKNPRCFFTVQSKVKKGIWTPVRDSYPVHTTSINQNNPSEIVWSLSFVDFAAGKTKSESTEFTPFTLECVILKKPFTFEQFNATTGFYFEIQAI